MDYFKFWTLKKALSDAEGQLTQGSLASVTSAVRGILSSSNVGQVLDQFLATSSELDGSGDAELHSSTEPAAEDNEPSRGDAYNCDEGIPDLLNDLHQKLHSLWPVKCKVAHKLMLRLEARREYKDGRHGHLETKVVELDTLSSWHDESHDHCWGRVVYAIGRKPPAPEPPKPRRPKVRFADDSDAREDPCHHHQTRSCRLTPSSAQQHKSDEPFTLCPLIQRSGRELKCFRVDLESQESTEVLDRRGVCSTKSMTSLSNLLPPMKMMETGSEPPSRSQRERSRGASHQLSLKERAELGLVFACSLLQLCKDGWGAKQTSKDEGAAALGAKGEGVWLSRDWTKPENGICFLPGHKKVDIRSPFLPVVFDDITGGDATAQRQHSGFSYHTSSIVALATTLVRFQHQEVIQELDSIWQDLVKGMGGRVPPATNWNALDTLLDEDVFEAYVDEKCKMAIRACIRGGLIDTIGYEDVATQKKLFHAMVVKPLAEYRDETEKKSRVDDLGVSRHSHANSGRDGRDSDHEDEDREENGDEWRNDFQDTAAFMTGPGSNASHRTAWLDKLKQLSTIVHKIQTRWKSKTIKPPKPIRIAVLDTGLNLTKEFFQNKARRAKIRKIADFVPPPSRTTAGEPIYVDVEAGGSTDSFGHGTLMTQFLMEVAPLAEIFIARVAADTDSLSLPASKEAVARAIKWASEQHRVDVISMSFGFAETDPSIHEAITSVQLTRRNSIIFLASAGNSSSEREKFPAYHRDVLSIRATDCDGVFLAKKPPQDGERPSLIFGAYGDDIPDRIASEYNAKICKAGSSIATAVAAAIAAVMLAYIESLPFAFATAEVSKSKGGTQLVLERELERQRDELRDLEKLRTVEGMSLLFNRMAPDKASHPMDRWISPVWFFGERATDVARKDALIELARGVRTPAPPSR